MSSENTLPDADCQLLVSSHGREQRGLASALVTPTRALIPFMRGALP